MLINLHLQNDLCDVSSEKRKITRFRTLCPIMCSCSPIILLTHVLKVKDYKSSLKNNINSEVGNIWTKHKMENKRKLRESEKPRQRRDQHRVSMARKTAHGLCSDIRRDGTRKHVSVLQMRRVICELHFLSRNLAIGNFVRDVVQEYFDVI